MYMFARCLKVGDDGKWVITVDDYGKHYCKSVERLLVVRLLRNILVLVVTLPLRS